MDAKQKRELLNELKNEFDDYIDYYDLMECLAGMSESKIESLKKNRVQNGLVDISYYANRADGTLLVSASGWKTWVTNNFKPVNEKAPLE